MLNHAINDLGTFSCVLCYVRRHAIWILRRIVLLGPMTLIVLLADITRKLVYSVTFKSAAYPKMSYLLNKCSFFECNWPLNDYFSALATKTLTYHLYTFDATVSRFITFSQHLTCHTTRIINTNEHFKGKSYFFIKLLQHTEAMEKYNNKLLFWSISNHFRKYL